MAFGANTQLEVNRGGSDTSNGGGFDPTATMLTNLTATSGNTSNPVVSSVSYSFVIGDINDFLFVKSGTNWIPGWYRIIAVSGGAATLDASVGSVLLYVAGAVFTNNTTAGVATTASPTAGTWSMDYSRSTGASIVYTDMVIDATTNTKFTSSLNPVSAQLPGNIIAVTSGTGFTVQRVVIASVTGTTATCDKSLGTLSSTGGNGGLGGALGSPGLAAALATVSTMNIWWEYDPIAINMSTATPGSFGPIALVTGVIQSIRGYDLVRGDLTGNRPKSIWTAGNQGSSTNMLSTAGAVNKHVSNIWLDGGSATNIMGFGLGGSKTAGSFCLATHFDGAGGLGYACTGSPTVSCKAQFCTTGFNPGNHTDGHADQCTTGFNQIAHASKCLCTACGTGISSAVAGTVITQCTVDGSTTAGISIIGSPVLVASCLVTNCSSGVAFSFGASLAHAFNLACYNNLSNSSGTPAFNSGPFASGATITSLTADPYINRAGNDYRPNDNNPGGRQVRNLGIGVYGQTDNADIGAVQHPDGPIYYSY